MKALVRHFDDQPDQFWAGPAAGGLRAVLTPAWRRSRLPDRRTPMGANLIAGLTAGFPPYTRPRGTVTSAGYRRVWCPVHGRQRPEHVIVWERAHGPVPAQHHVSHLNGDRLDNRLDNLVLRTRLDTRRLAGGCRLVDGQWVKPCRRCGVEHAIDHYYWDTRSGVQSWCRPCCVQYAVEYKRGSRTGRWSVRPERRLVPA
jgi:hypothetical protein